MREAAFLFLPGRSLHSRPEGASPAWWLRESLTVVEMLLILAADNPPNTSRYLKHHSPDIQLWQQMFLEEWDQDWTDSYADADDPLNTAPGRAEHRALVISYFECLHAVATHWESFDMWPEPFPLNTPLPSLTAPQIKQPEGFTIYRAGSFIQVFLTRLVRNVRFLMSSEHRESTGVYGHFHDMDEVLVNIHMLALFAERYRRVADVSPPMVERWLEIHTAAYLAYLDDLGFRSHDPETDEALYNIAQTYTRLIHAIRNTAV